MLNYVFLILAIVAEAAGTTLLKMSEQFTKLVPSIATLVCYVTSLYLLSHGSLKAYTVYNILP